MADNENKGFLNQPDTNKPFGRSRKLTGRTKIVLDAEEVTPNNLIPLMVKAMNIHIKNQSDIDYLWNYYKGDQPILNRTKTIREDICNQVVVNRANEIVTFKTGYLFGEPIAYTSRGTADKSVLDALNAFNDYMADVDKDAVDLEIATWCYVCGVGYRLTLPERTERDPDRAPFRMVSSDPRNTFKAYSNSFDGHDLFSCRFSKNEDTGVTTYTVYTNDRIYTLTGNGASFNSNVSSVPLISGHNPITEYTMNETRIGAFELVIALLDAINEVESDRVDGVDQFIQALLLFHNVDIDEERIERLKELGAIVFSDASPDKKGDITYLNSELNQSQTQTLIDDMYDTVLTICGMPNRQSGSGGTSDNGIAVVYRDGWSDAATRAKENEAYFKKAENKFIRTALAICKDLRHLNLSRKDMDIKFTYRNADNLQTKAQVLVQLLDKIPPHTAYTISNMFPDAEAAYEEYVAWKKEQDEKAQQIQQTQANNDSTGNGGNGEGETNPDTGTGESD